MDVLRLRVARDGALWVRVAGGRPVKVDTGGLRRVVGRATRAQVWLATPGLMLDARVLAVLHDPPASLAEVCVGGELFVLAQPFDAAALALVAGTCSRLRADPGSGWAGAPLPDALRDALQVQSASDSSRRPETTPVSKAARRARATSSS